MEDEDVEQVFSNLINPCFSQYLALRKVCLKVSTQYIQ